MRKNRKKKKRKKPGKPDSQELSDSPQNQMLHYLFLYTGAAFTFIWGVAHLFPTRSVVKGFGEISPDNRHIITMEWIIEGISLIFMGFLVALVTYIDPHAVVSHAIYILTAIGLISLAIISLMTGFKVNFLPFRLCPVIFTASAVLILAGSLLQP